MKLWIFRTIIVAVIALPIAAAEMLLGLYQDTGVIRREARMFRAEADYLRLSTRNIVPNIQHAYSPSQRDATWAILKDTPRLFRSDELGTIIGPEPAEEAGRTILFLGGSTTESNEVDEAYRFPALVQAKLASLGGDVRTINGGVRGHTTLDAINSLLNRPEFRAADTVVLMENINDRLFLEIRGSYQASLGRSPPTSIGALAGASRGWLTSLWDLVSYRSNVLFLIRSAGGGFNAWTGETLRTEVTEANINKGGVPDVRVRNLYAENLAVFVAVTRALGKEPMLMTQALGVDSPAHESFNAVVRSSSESLGVRMIDPASALGQNRQWAFLSDNIHLNNVGSEAVADIIVHEMSGALDLDAPLFSRRFLNDVSDVLNICADEPGPVQLGSTYQLPIASGRYPSLSPDRSWLSFQSWRDGRDRVHVMRLLDGQVLDISADDAPASERHPVFLDADENSFSVVLGVGHTEGQPQSFERLFVHTWPSGKREQLPLPSMLGAAIPTVHAQKVFFAGFLLTGTNRGPDIFAYDLVDHSLTQITETSHEEWRPAVSAGGTVYFISNEHGQFDIYHLAPRAMRPELFYGSAADEWDPAISPDERWIAFASKVTGQWEIYLMEATRAGSPVQLTTGPGNKWDPAWDPSGRILLYAGNLGSDNQIFAVCPFGESAP